MFFRRVFSRKSSSSVDSDHRIPNHNADTSTIAVPISPHRLQRNQVKLNEGFSVLQLTPLWEHIIRTKSLPSNINEKEMFSEFLERLYDPEWQVRQHALKVLVDVLIIMSQRADPYFSPLIKPLVENLGHAAPAVQKGALDCLKVYMSETGMPETVLLEIIGVGMEQKLMNSALFGRQCIAVMLSLPSLIQTQLLNKVKRNFIIKAAIDALTVKMAQVTYQETALKVLLRIRQMIGSREFAEHIAHGDHREFELLCNVYGLPDYLPTRDSRNDLYDASDSIKYSAWQVLSPDIITNHNMRPSETCWKSTTEDEADDSDISTDPKYLRKAKSCPNVFPDEKVIMETEINIENTPITLRILEEKSYDGVTNEENSCLTSVYEHSGIIRVLTDSELDEMNNGEYYTRGRTPRRVTFGGESVKLRTPDTDSVNQSDNDVKSRRRTAESNGVSVADILHIDIPTDNTKELLSQQRSKSARISRSDSISPNSQSPMERAKSARHRRVSLSPDIISPTPSHKQIEVLHNLQRSPMISPDRHKRSLSTGGEKNSAGDKGVNDQVNETDEHTRETDRTKEQEQRKTWEDLDIVDTEALMNLKSGDWRLRSNAICKIEDALKSTENLAMVQPYLDSLLRTLLSSDDKNVMEDKCRVLVNLISRLPLENLEDQTDQIIVGLCRQGGAESNHIAKSLLQRLPPTVVVHKLLSEDFLNTRSARFRENALQIVLFALMTFPSTCFDIPMCVGRAVQAAMDRKRRVRQAALDVLAVLGQISSPKSVLDIVHQNSANREDGERLLSAVKARLARKQLPLISPNGSVQYALRIPSPESNAVMYLFGADIEWINAGVGYVSPLSLKRHSTRLHQRQNYLGYDKNATMEDTAKQQRHKAPHEILAVGVGVKPPYDYNSNIIGNIGGYTKGTMDDDKNTHFVIATSIPSNSVPVNFNGGNKVKFQGKSFPEQLSATLNDSRESSREHSDSSNGNKPTKLPVTSRFPAMENHYEVRHGKSSNKNPSTYSNHNSFKNGSNRYVYTSNSSQESPSDLSSNDEHRTYTYSSSSSPVRQRFANVNKYLSKKSNDHIKTEEVPFTRVQQISTVSSPSIDRTNSTILLTSAEDPDDNIVYEYTGARDVISNITQTENRSSAHSKTSSKRLLEEIKSNSNSPSKKSLDENILESSSQHTIVAVDEKVENVQSTSRPISVLSNATTKSLHDECDIRPSTSLAKSNVSSASTTFRDNKSRISLLADETDRPISSNSRPTSHIGDVDVKNEKNSEDEKSVDLHEEITPQNVVKDEQEEQDGKVMQEEQDANNDHDGQKQNAMLQEEDVHVQDDTAQVEDEPEEVVILAETQEEVPVIGTMLQSIIINNETDDIAVDAVDETDFTKDRSDELTTTSTVSSIHNFSTRPSIRFRKRKVSPIKQVIPLASRQKIKDQHIACLQQLDSSNWDQIMLGLQLFVSLMRNNPEQIEPHLHQYCLALSKNIKNLRSQVSRASCQAAGEFFESHSKLLEQEADDLALALLNRTADTNKFLRSDATKALKIMCETLSVPKVIQIVTTKGATHQNAVVRTASANLCNQIIERCGVDKIYAMNRDLRDKLIVTGANLLLEGSLDTRNHAKTFFKQLSHHPFYHKTLLDVIPPRTYRNIEKSLKSIK